MGPTYLKDIGLQFQDFGRSNRDSQWSVTVGCLGILSVLVYISVSVYHVKMSLVWYHIVNIMPVYSSGGGVDWCPRHMCSAQMKCHQRPLPFLTSAILFYLVFRDVKLVFSVLELLILFSYILFIPGPGDKFRVLIFFDIKLITLTF